MKDTIRYADIMENDVVDGFGICVSLWVQGCPYHCKNCHNEQTWDFNAGTEININKLTNIILNNINKDGIVRNFSVLGGEPLCSENIDSVAYIINKVRDTFNDINIFLWTGNIYENLIKDNNKSVTSILNNIDILVDGPYIDNLRNLNLLLRGSENQRVINIKKMRENNNLNNIILYDDTVR